VNIRRYVLILFGDLLYFLAMTITIRSLIIEGTSRKIQILLLIAWLVVLLSIIFLIWLGIKRKSDWLINGIEGIINWIAGVNAWVRGIIFVIIAFAPVLLIYTDLDRGLMDSTAFRFLVYIPLIILAALFFPAKEPEAFSAKLAITAMTVAYTLMAALYLNQITQFPLSLSWSEGNRFYDYSLVFGQGLYQYEGELNIPYGAPGRYGLWGVWFLLPELSIGYHRAWNALLWFLPTLIFGWFAAAGISSKPVRFGIALWVALFLNQGPIYAPLVISAIIVAIFLLKRPIWIRSGSAGLASLYAGLSRWTWFAIAGVWGALIDLGIYYPKRPGKWYQRLLPVFILVLAGSLPGLVANANRFLTPRSSTLSFSQPLLWYRLLPNVTYKPGILLGFLIAVGACLILIGWLVLSKRWVMDWLQLVSFAGTGITLFAAGIVASTKIGGGSNLHNLDMFLVTLVFVIGIYFAAGNEFKPGKWPLWAQTLVLIAILVPAWAPLTRVPSLNLPAEEDVQIALEKIQRKANQADGDVLFIDQRQLLTFGYIQDIELIPDYEKKYIMDQAMAGNEEFFRGFYRDLADKRFALIVSEILFTRQQDRTSAFGEENNVWVAWVSEPLLCYYKPSETMKKVGIQLLVPAAEIDECLELYPPE
jgi:hypothetical protein